MEIHLSFVVPVFNEEANIRPLCRRIHAACETAGLRDYEIVLVENGSLDSSEAVIREEHRRDSRVRMIRLSRNFGYQGGVSAGLAHARGLWVGVLDGDQQDPPELVLSFLKHAQQERLDVVYGVRMKRREGLFKRLAYALFYRLWRATSSVRVPLDAGDFCVMRRPVVDCIVRMPERLRFVRGLRAWAGFRQGGVPYSREARGEGDTKFGLSGMIALALDGLLAYSVLPLRVMTVSGLVVSGLAFLTGTLWATLRVLVWCGVRDLPFVLPPGLTQVNLLVTFLLGFNILAVGVVGEYVGRIYEEVKGRPVFVVHSTTDDKGSGA